jgi:hypothetical protein
LPFGERPGADAFQRGYLHTQDAAGDGDTLAFHLIGDVDHAGASGGGKMSQ